MNNLNQSRATLQRDEKIQELKTRLAEICERENVSRLMIFPNMQVFSSMLNMQDILSCFDVEFIESFCERLEIPEYLRKDLGFAEDYYYRFILSVSV